MKKFILALILTVTLAGCGGTKGYSSAISSSK